LKKHVGKSKKKEQERRKEKGRLKTHRANPGKGRGQGENDGQCKAVRGMNGDAKDGNNGLSYGEQSLDKGAFTKRTGNRLCYQKEMEIS